MPELHAGALSTVLAEGRLHDVRVAGRPALDTLYVAVRNAGWGTVPGQIVISSTAGTAAGTITKLEVRHELDDIGFRWYGTIEASAGRVRFTMDGVAETAFDANRIGFCLLHPQTLKGQLVRVSGAGRVRSGGFTEKISPQQLFVGVERMRYGVGGGAELEIGFEGDVFEVEDHRNWSDPGWKTYGTPLAAPRPVHYAAGQLIHQAVELRAHPAVPGPHLAVSGARRAAADGTVRVTVRTEVAGAVPSLGLGACGLPSVVPAARDAVRDLRPAYLHAELEDGPAWASALELAAEEAAALGVPLDVAVIAAPDRVTAMTQRIAGTTAELGRVSVFSPGSHTTDVGTVMAVRAVLRGAGRDAAVGGGSRAHFAELNRGHFDATDWDFVTYGLTPQVHHTDDRSILATTDAVADGAGQARMITGGLPLVVGPITLRPRFNAAAEPPGPLAPRDGGPDVDERQHTQLAAAYLAAVISKLPEARAATAFQTIGRRGVVTAPGVPTPAARVVSVLTPLAGMPVRRTRSTGAVAALAAVTPAGLLILATNLAHRRARLQLAGVKVSQATVLGGDALDPDRLVLPARSVTSIQAVEA